MEKVNKEKEKVNKGKRKKRIIIKRREAIQ